jgi:hypothetical protein
VASAAAGVPDLDRLRAAMLEPDWVAEEPEAHLLPHVRRLCAERGWSVERADVVDDVLEVEVAVPGARGGDLEIAGFALIGTFAESSTHVVHRRHDGATELLLTTGVLEGDAVFAAHGHVVRLRLTG